jgi:hypothetical protein
MSRIVVRCAHCLSPCRGRLTGNSQSATASNQRNVLVITGWLISNRHDDPSPGNRAFGMKWRRRLAGKTAWDFQLST